MMPDKKLFFVKIYMTNIIIKKNILKQNTKFKTKKIKKLNNYFVSYYILTKTEPQVKPAPSASRMI